MSIILECIRTVGRGERGRKPLSEQQAFDVMEAYLASKETGDDSVGDDQMAMLLMLIRVQNETNEEIAGFVKAFQSRMPSLDADIDWPCYAGKRKNEEGTGLPWHGLAAKILSLNGYKVLLHGYKDDASGRVHIQDYLSQLGISQADDLEQAQFFLQQNNITYLSLDTFAPIAKSMMSWKNRYGLRTPINTVVRALNPGAARIGVRGSFHPGFQQLHAEIDQKIDRKSLSVVSYKGQNGESEYNPKVSQTVWVSDEKGVSEHYWSANVNNDLPLLQNNPFDVSDKNMHQLMSNAVVTSMAAALFAENKDYASSYVTACRFWQSYCEN
ncbi:glycosyl transferase family protein [Vibrio sp.]|uniref:glycosyl transferase family protein n=1 Tax=Vibrio sp. TaxID=678 RepID=UPI003AA9169A